MSDTVAVPRALVERLTTKFRQEGILGWQARPDMELLLATLTTPAPACPACDGEGTRITVDPDERMALPHTCGRCGGSGHLCPKCHAPMRPGQAIQNTLVGVPDLGTVVTVSPGGPGKLVDCLKCTKCGHSVTL